MWGRMPGAHTFYDGSRLLDPIAAWIGFDTDKLNLVLCQFVAIPLATAYNLLLPPSTMSRQWRLALPFIVGICLCYFCYGSAIKHILANATVCYLLMKYAPTKHVHRVVFIFSMSYLMFIHWFRWHVLSVYYIDVTGPIMIMVQKCTTLAFSLHDGRVKKREELNEVQKREAISDVPGVLEYLSYLFAFQTVLTGPLFFYNDYMHFIQGDVVDVEGSGRRVPNPWSAAFTKLVVALCCFGLILAFDKDTQPEIIANEANLLLPWWRWWILFYFVILMQRVKYYYAWTLADAICNFSGFGFNGYTVDGEERWNLVSNVDIWKVEVATSFKETLDGWNMTTMHWLRRVAYDRVPKNYRTVSTYLLSAFWHGFSAGYYITFVTGAIVTLGARTARRCLRHRFQSSRWTAVFYDVLTFFATKVALIYTTFPFVTMNLNPGWFIYKRLYFFGHLMAIFSMLVLPRIVKPLPTRTKTERRDDGRTETILKPVYGGEEEYTRNKEL